MNRSYSVLNEYQFDLCGVVNKDINKQEAGREVVQHLVQASEMVTNLKNSVLLHKKCLFITFNRRPEIKNINLMRSFVLLTTVAAQNWLTCNMVASLSFSK
jgi:hypothetical protein